MRCGMLIVPTDSHFSLCLFGVVCFVLIVTNNMELINMLKRHHPMFHAPPEWKLQTIRPGISPLGVLHSSKELRMRNPAD